MGEVSPGALFSFAVITAIFVTMQWRRTSSPDLLFLGGLVAVTIFGVVSPEEALQGFANPALLTIGALFVVAASLQATGVVDRLGAQLLGTARSAREAVARLAAAVVGSSAFVNNTPVVAMLVPVALSWCRRRGISPSKLLIPLSYLAILGGTCTLIGTSTNILVSGLLKSHGMQPMSLFEIGWVGLPCAVVGTGYLLLAGYRLLPDRTDLIERLGRESREYLVEMIVEPNCRLIGKTVEQAGLRHLRGLFLIEIDRQDELLTPVTPHDVIRAGDRLVFTGVVTTIVDLTRIPGLVSADEVRYELDRERRAARRLCEVVISNSSPLIGSTIREANFRRLYNAVVVAVHRNGERLPSKIGDIRLQPGDTLLLQTRTEFSTQFRHSRDFYLVADVEGSEPVRHEKAWVATALFAGLVVWLAGSHWLGLASRWPGLAEPAIAAVAVAGLMVFTRCLRAGQARSAIDLQVLITIGAALGIGKALENSGAADAVANFLVGASVGSPYILLAVVYAITITLTELITNVAVAAMLFPLVIQAAAAGGYSPRPFVITLALAASLSFLTPVGYQTNLMVMGPGGYQPRDYLRVGAPLALLLGIVVLGLVPVVWPFTP